MPFVAADMNFKNIFLLGLMLLEACCFQFFLLTALMSMYQYHFTLVFHNKMIHLDDNKTQLDLFSQIVRENR